MNTDCTEKIIMGYVWVIESNWPSARQEWGVHSIYEQFAVAKAAGKDFFDHLQYDAAGCGVRMRRGIIDETGFSIEPRVYWVEMCRRPVIIIPKIMDEDEDDGDF